MYSKLLLISITGALNLLVSGISEAYKKSGFLEKKQRPEKRTEMGEMTVSAGAAMAAARATSEQPDLSIAVL